MKKSALLCLIVCLLPLVALSLDKPEPLDPENFEAGQVGRFSQSKKYIYQTAENEPAEDEVIVFGLRLVDDTYVSRGDPFILKGVDRSKIKIGKEIPLGNVYKVLKTKRFSNRTFWVIRAATPEEKAAYEKAGGK